MKSAFRSRALPSPVRLQRRTLFGRRTAAQRGLSAFWTVTGVVLGGALLVYAHDSRAGIHRWLVIPALHAYTKDDAELSHRIAVRALETGLTPVDRKPDAQDVIGLELWGRRFSNPVGLAAGFDKHAEAIDGLFDLGFGYVEIGSVTPEPQPGNPPPRLFRITDTDSVVNRYGFNSEGHDAVLARLRLRVREFVHRHAHLLPTSLFPPTPPGAAPDRTPVVSLLASPAGADAKLPDALGSARSLRADRVLAVNLGKNKSSAPDVVDDYVQGVRKLGPLADVVVVNVSSPNTPGLRSLQRRGMLEELLGAVVKARDALPDPAHKPAVVLKVAPDLTTREIRDIASAALETKIDGLIVSNTTVSRPSSAGTDPKLAETGGLSGPPLKPIALPILASFYVATEGKLPLVGCGGIRSGDDALDYARAGASFVQLYTALGYEGVGLPARIKDDLTDRLRAEGSTWTQQIGRDAKALAHPPAPAAGSQEEAIADLRSDLATVMRELERSEREAADKARAARFGADAFGGTPMPALSAVNQGTVPTATTGAPTSGFTTEPQIIVVPGSDAAPLPTPAEAKPAAPPSSVEHAKPRSLSLPPTMGKGKGLWALGSTFGERAKAGTSGRRLV